MKVLKTVIGVLAILIGISGILMGTNIIQGASMSGQDQFALAGIVAIFGGGVLLNDAWSRDKE